jgi:hypothetical protein
MMRVVVACSVALALAACAENKSPPPAPIKERACGVLDPYTGNVSSITPDDARIWAAGTNAALARLCQARTK